MSRIKENRGGNKVKRPVPAMPPIKGQREYGVVVQNSVEKSETMKVSDRYREK